RNCRNFTSSSAISAVQIWILRALAEVPTNVLTRRFCFNSRKNCSICQRLAVQFRDSGGGQIEMIGQKEELPPILGVPEGNPAKVDITLLASVAGEADHFVAADAVSVSGPLFHSHETGVFLQPGDEPHALLSQLAEPFVIVVAAIHDQHGVRRPA